MGIALTMLLDLAFPAKGGKGSFAKVSASVCGISIWRGNRESECGEDRLREALRKDMKLNGEDYEMVLSADAIPMEKDRYQLEGYGE